MPLPVKTNRALLGGGAALASLTFDTAGGGLSILQVQAAVNKLKETGEQRAKEEEAVAAPTKGERSDPFQALTIQIQDRLETVNRYQAGECEKPAWLQEQEEKVGRSKKKPSTQQLAQRERENERAFMIEQDLEKAQQE